MEDPQRLPQTLSPCSSGRRLSSDSNSPEFEFWMIRNPSFPQPELHSADELFSDGVLLPLQILRPHLSDEQSEPQPPPPPPIPPPPPAEGAPSGFEQVSESKIASTDESAALSTSTVFTSSKRWKDIFKRSDKKNAIGVNNNGNSDCSGKEKDRCKEKKREKKSGGGGGSNGVSAAELNINIWPFLRSRSAGNGGSRPRTGAGSAAAMRKVSSAPCSRSNSGGESKTRKLPSSPSRGGVHLGRSSPVWQVRRCGVGSSAGRSTDLAVKNCAEKVVKKDGNETRRKISTATSVGGDVGTPKRRVLSLNVPMCIGYRHNLGCRSDENSSVAVAAASTAVSGGGETNGSVSGEGVRGSNLFNIRSLFTKKVY